MRNSHLRKSPWHRLSHTMWLFLLVLACKSEVADKASQSDQHSQESESSTNPPAGQKKTSVDTSSKKQSGASAILDLLRWIDPQANDLWMGRESRIFDPDTFATLMALPPRAAKAISDIHDFENALNVYLGDTDSNPKHQFQPAFAVFRPAVASGNFILRNVKDSTESFTQNLLSNGWTERKYDGISQYSRLNANFPWKIAILDNDTIAGIPLGEIGSGLGPLNIARELPITGMRQQIEQQFESNPSMVALLFSAGPMLHWNLSENVDFVRLAVQRWKSKGYDITTEMGYTGDHTTALNDLRSRELNGQSNQLKLIADRVAFEFDAGHIAGRIQITNEDLVHLKPRDGLL